MFVGLLRALAYSVPATQITNSKPGSVTFPMLKRLEDFIRWIIVFSVWLHLTPVLKCKCTTKPLIGFVSFTAANDNDLPFLSSVKG